MYMDDIKLFAQNKKVLETLIHAVNMVVIILHILTMLVFKSGKRDLTDGRELTNQDKIRTLGEN